MLKQNDKQNKQNDNKQKRQHNKTKTETKLKFSIMRTGKKIQGAFEHRATAAKMNTGLLGEKQIMHLLG